MGQRLMMTRGCLTLEAHVVQPSTSAHDNLHRTMYLTFNRDVRLPGVTLAPGTYIFELAEPLSGWDIVRVVSVQRDREHFSGLTRRVARVAGMRDAQVLSFGDVMSDEAPAVRIWYPKGESTGRLFIHP